MSLSNFYINIKKYYMRNYLEPKKNALKNYEKLYILYLIFNIEFITKKIKKITFN